MPADLQTGTGKPLVQIETALKTDIIDILRNSCDRLAWLDRHAAYEAVMNEPDMLHEAFTLLQREPQLFAAAIVDENGMPVEARDEQRLRCGETLGHIKTMVLRVAARRHFRKKLGGPRVVLVRPKRQIGVGRRLLEAMRLAKPPPPRRRRVAGRGDSLYKAIREYLLYDWQARLIPHYAQFSPDNVAKLGASIFEIREPAELRALSGPDSRDALSQDRRPLFLGGADQLMKRSDNTLDSELLWKLWDQMGLLRLFDGIELTERRQVISDIAGTSNMAISLLSPILGNDVRRFVTFLFVAYKVLGRSEYHHAFTDTGATQWITKVFVDRLSKLPGLPPPSLEPMTEVFTQVLSLPNERR